MPGRAIDISEPWRAGFRGRRGFLRVGFEGLEGPVSIPPGRPTLVSSSIPKPGFAFERSLETVTMPAAFQRLLDRLDASPFPVTLVLVGALVGGSIAGIGTLGLSTPGTTLLFFVGLVGALGLMLSGDTVWLEPTVETNDEPAPRDRLPDPPHPITPRDLWISIPSNPAVFARSAARR